MNCLREACLHAHRPLQGLRQIAVCRCNRLEWAKLTFDGELSPRGIIMFGLFFFVFYFFGLKANTQGGSAGPTASFY